MYTQQDYLNNRAQLKRRLIAVSLPVAVFIAGIVVTLMVRTKDFSLEWLTSLLTILGGGLCIFCYSMYIGPVIAYGRHLTYILEGRLREATGYLVSFEEDTVIRDGVEYHAMMVNVGERNDEEDNRLFYYDANREWGNIPIGGRVHVVAHDKAVATINIVN